jgi:hypothetical protein
VLCVGGRSLSTKDYARACEAVTALKLTGTNKEFAAYWLSRWRNNSAPKMNSFILHRDSQYAPATGVMEVRQNQSLRCIRGGAFIKLALGFDLTNQDILAMTAEGDRAARLAWAWQIAKGAVAVARRPFQTRGGLGGSVQIVFLPFSDEKSDGSRYFQMHTNWRPEHADWIEGSVTVDLQSLAERNIISFNNPMPENPETANIAFV